MAFSYTVLHINHTDSVRILSRFFFFKISVLIRQRLASLHYLLINAYDLFLWIYSFSSQKLTASSLTLVHMSLARPFHGLSTWATREPWPPSSAWTHPHNSVQKLSMSRCHPRLLPNQAWSEIDLSPKFYFVRSSERNLLTALKSFFSHVTEIFVAFTLDSPMLCSTLICNVFF